MLNIMKAEYLKTKRTMSMLLIPVFPVIVLGLAFVLTMNMTNAYSESVWNWWYTLLLPGMLAIISYLSVVREKKTKYYNLMTLSTGRKKLMLGKILFMAVIMLVANTIVFAGATIGGKVLTTCVPTAGAVAAVIALTVVSMWEIPLFLFLSERFGMIVELIACLVITVAGILFAPTSKWIFLVSAIPMRVACPLLHIMPNGLRLEAGNPLMDASVILPGILISLVWFVIGTVLYLNWFDKREVK
ncbi:MAG: lantibiotic immunity ABC transporter MutE/EpiE family permease subunit [Lachnospiraceae bacterium]|nr:lantibiotic immunity ABC transporter MutE/EpiE family permease subunit [Lachnospiraceae bacterium]